MPPYPYETQVDLVNCCFLLFNFVKKYQHEEDEFDEIEDSDGELEESSDEEDGEENDIERIRSRDLREWRDGIAQGMWQDYVRELIQRGDRDVIPP